MGFICSKTRLRTFFVSFIWRRSLEALLDMENNRIPHNKQKGNANIVSRAEIDVPESDGTRSAELPP